VETITVLNGNYLWVRAVLNSEKNFFMGAKNLKKLSSVIQIHFTREIFFVKQTMRFEEKQL